MAKSSILWLGSKEVTYPEKPPGSESEPHVLTIVYHHMGVWGNAQWLNVPRPALGFWEVEGDFFGASAAFVQVKIQSMRDVCSTIANRFHI